MSFCPAPRLDSDTTSLEVAMTTEAVVRASQPTKVLANGVELCVQTFGDPESPAILLIGGAASSMDWWEEEFCERLSSGARFVIRYDLRDTGQSVSYEPGAPQYDGTDLVTDAVGVLDALRVSRAHIVGISMGGGIAQHLALDHADRVASLTLISTSPGGPDLPPMSDELRARFEDPAPEPDWSDRQAVVDYLVEDLRPFAGTLPFDEAAMRALVGRIVDRTSNIASTTTNHSILAGGEALRPRLREITAPTLVLHGTEDPLFPYGHGEALAAEIPGARLLPLEGVGHEVPPRPVWDQVVGAILDHTAEESRSHIGVVIEQSGQVRKDDVRGDVGGGDVLTPGCPG
jgi:pimeloyl-ACP methyl ester carboxylesterase